MSGNTTQANARSWGFLFTEAALIVASILLAFALDSWWDERKDRVEEGEILRGLRQEFAHGRETLVRNMEQHFSQQDTLVELIAATRSGRWDAATVTPDLAVAALISPGTTDLGAGVLRALISSGRIELLSSRELRWKLTGWEQVWAEVQDDELMWRGLIFDTVLPYLLERGVRPSGPMFAWGDSWPVDETNLEPVLLADDPERLAALLADPEFAALVETRFGFEHHTSAEYRAALAALDDILAAIDRSLAALEG